MDYLDAKIKQMKKPLNLRKRKYERGLPTEPEPPFRPDLIDRLERLDRRLETPKYPSFEPLPDIANDVMDSNILKINPATNPPKYNMGKVAMCRMEKTTERKFPNILSVKETFSFSGDCHGLKIDEESSTGLDIDLNTGIAFLGRRHKRKITL